MINRIPLKNFFLTVSIISIMLNVGVVSNCFSSEKLTLDKCIDIAKKNNKQLEELRLEKELKSIQLKSAWYNIFPQLDFSMNYSDRLSYDYADDSENRAGNYSAGFRLTQSVFSSGKNTTSIKKARNNYKITEYNCIEKENDLVRRIKRNYYQVLKNISLVKTGEEALKRKENNYSLIKLLYQVGNEKITNLNQAKYYIDKEKYSLFQATKSLEIAKSKLKQEMGIPLDAPLELEEQFASYDFKYAYSETEVINKALEYRFDLKQVELSIENVKLERTSAKSEFLPSASLSADYSWYGNKFFPDRDGWNTMFSVSFPISEGFPLYTRLKENKINFLSSEIRKETLIENITIEAKEAHLNITLAKEKMKLAYDNLKVAKERSTLAELEYSQGTISFVEFEDIEERLSKAESELIEAKYAYEIAIAELENTIGILLTMEVK